VKPEETEILVRCHELQAAHRHVKRPHAVYKWERMLWDETREFGPIYLPSDWFGEIPNAIRQRYLRAIAALERAGLVTTWATYGRRLSRLKLTPVGEAEVERLAATEAKP
jgi:hypothetical protein